MAEKKPKKKESSASLKRKIKELVGLLREAEDHVRHLRYLKIVIERRVLMKLYEVHFSGRTLYGPPKYSSPAQIHAMDPLHVAEILKENMVAFTITSIKTIAF